MDLLAEIPLLQILKYVVASFGETKDVVVKFLTPFHEENQVLFCLATMGPGYNMPRSKFYAIKHHWFRSLLKPSEIELLLIESKKHKVDTLLMEFECCHDKKNSSSHDFES
jgi:hypothetical protein